ncbi:MAG: TonB-dependent receptor [Gammaproteobacteria bacterium]|nr:TonB-dependent receptor [Gammaproteobacteria bacterium]
MHLPALLQPSFFNLSRQCRTLALRCLWCSLLLPSLLLPCAALQAGPIEEVEVVAATPVSGLAPDLQRLPYAVQHAVAEQLRNSHQLDITDFANSRLGSVSINSAQNNPLQPDLQFRGFTASPLLGLPQGMTVYQNGVRLNEPLGDAVNWDLLPASAIAELTLHSGANPLFGLNTLGGAVVATMKNGFNFDGRQLEMAAGSRGRERGVLEAGGNNGQWGYYANVDSLREDGWRDHSPSETLRWYGSLSWRDGDRSGLNLALQQGDSDLTGNGASPLGLLQEDRRAVFTAPDNTRNHMRMASLEGFHFISDGLQLAGSAYWRDNDTGAFNGDASELELCRFAGGAEALLEDVEELEDVLEAQLDIELDEICNGADTSVNSYASLARLIEDRAQAAGLDPDSLLPEDISAELPAGAELSDEAINNISQRRQRSRGLDLQLSWNHRLLGRSNSLVVGAGYSLGESGFSSVTELAGLDPSTRSTRGLGTGTLLADESVQVRTRSRNASLLVANTLRWSDALTLTLAGRFNRTEVRLRDRSGERPELDGDHRFSRFNPSLGLHYQASPGHQFYASLSESSRAPTPIELACNEGVFEVARRFALERGDDPDDIDFECRLPNAFLADPPLQQVVASHIEVGSRGQWRELDYSLGLFSTRNRDDILFQSTGRATGLFANVDATRRRGLELGLSGARERFDWSLNYAWIDATFESDMAVLSPNHAFADAAGEIQVRKGDRLPSIPRQQLKLLGQFELGAATKLGLELIHNSDQVLRGDESNQLDRVSSFTLVNLNLAYAPSERWQLYLRVDNLFDREYENFGLLGEDPTEVIPALANPSPVFLGAGAPRGAWVGLQWRL